MAAHIDRTNTRSLRKRLVAVLAGLMIFALVSASAATLNVNTQPDVGANTQTVAACDQDGVDVAFTTGFSGGEYVIDGVTVSGIDATACDGQNIAVTLLDGSDVVLDDDSGTVGGTSVTLSGLSASAQDVEKLAIVISS